MASARVNSNNNSGGMLRARRRDICIKPNRKLDRKSSRGMIYENEELRLRTIHINAEVEQGILCIYIDAHFIVSVISKGNYSSIQDVFMRANFAQARVTLKS